MTRIAKLYQRLLDGRPLTFAEYERLLRAFGFVFDHQRGSHRIFRHVATGRKLNAQPLGKAAKGYQLTEFLDMIEEMGLTLGETE